MSKRKRRAAQILMTPIDRVARRVSGFYKHHRRKRRSSGAKPGPPQKCGCCGKVFSNLVALRQHRVRRHAAIYQWKGSRPQQVRCRLCQEVLTNDDNARKEHLGIHPIEDVLNVGAPGLFEPLDVENKDSD